MTFIDVLMNIKLLPETKDETNLTTNYLTHKSGRPILAYESLFTHDRNCQPFPSKLGHVFNSSNSFPRDLKEEIILWGAIAICHSSMMDYTHLIIPGFCPRYSNQITNVLTLRQLTTYCPLAPLSFYYGCKILRFHHWL